MKLLALVESSDHVCCRYRVKAFEPALVREGVTLDCQPLGRGLASRLSRLRSAGEHDAVLLQRKLLPAWQLAILRRSARYLAFDFDDAVLFRDSYDPRGPRSYWRERRFARTVRTVDAVIAGNDFLADCALRAGADPTRVHVIPTCVDPARYRVAQQGCVGLEAGPELVWIGSSSTLKGIEQAGSVWEEAARLSPRARMRILCDRFPAAFPLPVVPVVWSESSEAAELAKGHVGVSLLPDDAWSRGKCGLKVLQYQAAGLPVVANPVGAHMELVRTGETGYLAKSPEEWARAIRRLGQDPELREAMGAEGRRRVEQGYSVGAWSRAFVASATGRVSTGAGECWTLESGERGQARPRLASGPARGSMRPLHQIGDR